MSEQSFQPKQTHYRAAYAHNADGTYGPHWEAEDCFLTPQEALEHVSSVVEGEGHIGIVFECRPIFIVTRRPVKVTKLDGAP